MSDLYNFRIGDMLYRHSKDGRPIMGLVYKLTPKYVYYAICAGSESDKESSAWVSKGHKTKKERIYSAILEGSISVSYAGGTGRRRIVEGSCLVNNQQG